MCQKLSSLKPGTLPISILGSKDAPVNAISQPVGKKRTGSKVNALFFSKWPESYTIHFYLYPIGLNLVTMYIKERNGGEEM